MAIPLMAAGLALGAAGGLMSAFGKKKQVAPKYKGVELDEDAGQVDYAAALSGNVQANQALFGPSTKLAADVNDFNISEQADLVNTAVPQAQKFFSSAFDNYVNPLMAGQLPQDVVDAVARNAAQVSTSRGFGAGSGMGRNLSARDFGLTTLDLMGRGVQTGSSLTNQMWGLYGTSLFRPESQFGTPNMAVSTALSNAQNKSAVRNQEALFNVGIANQNAANAAAIENSTKTFWEKLGGAMQSIGGGMSGFGTMGGQSGGGSGGGGNNAIAPYAAGWSQYQGSYYPQARLV